MDTKNADLSALRIDRAEPTRRSTGVPRGVVVASGALAVLAAVAVVVARGIAGGVPVRLAPATLVSPSQANVVVIASGYVVAQRKAAVASKATGRLVYLGVAEGDQVRRGQVIARIEDSDVKRARRSS